MGIYRLSHGVVTLEPTRPRAVRDAKARRLQKMAVLLLAIAPLSISGAPKNRSAYAASRIQDCAGALRTDEQDDHVRSHQRAASQFAGRHWIESTDSERRSSGVTRRHTIATRLALPPVHGASGPIIACWLCAKHLCWYHEFWRQARHAPWF